MAELEVTRERIRQTLKRRDAQVESFVLRLQRLLDTEIKKIIRQIETGNINGLEAAAALEGIEGALREAGIGKELAGAVRIYKDEIQEVVAGINATVPAAQEVAVTDSDLTVLEKLVTFENERLENRIGTYVGDVRTIVYQSVITGQRFDQSILDDTLSPRLKSQIQTEMDTELMAFNRTVNTSKAKEAGLKYFLYQGPDDKITRPFCQALLDKVFTVEELAAMDNEQGLPVPQYLGGYNCRHFLVPVDNDLAEQIRNES